MIFLKHSREIRLSLKFQKTGESKGEDDTLKCRLLYKDRVKQHL